jgi:hypothetical protein
VKEVESKLKRKFTFTLGNEEKGVPGRNYFFLVAASEVIETDTKKLLVYFVW